MNNSRRRFLRNTITGAAAAGLGFSGLRGFASSSYNGKVAAKTRLRFAIASDGHYGQPNTDFDGDHRNIIKWLNTAHAEKPLDFVIFNGDIVHDRPALLSEVRSKYFEKLRCPYYAVQGNHDHADDALWKSVFGYGNNHSFVKNGAAIVMANTSNTTGEYICPDTSFLASEIAKYSDQQTVFVVMHIPPEKWLQEKTFYLECPEALALFEEHKNVKAVFHGHDHDADGVHYSGKKTPHFFDAHYGGSWGTDYMGYRIVEVGDDNTVHTFQVNASASPVLSSHDIK